MAENYRMIIVGDVVLIKIGRVTSGNVLSIEPDSLGRVDMVDRRLTAAYAVRLLDDSGLSGWFTRNELELYTPAPKDPEALERWLSA